MVDDCGLSLSLEQDQSPTTGTRPPDLLVVAMSIKYG